MKKFTFILLSGCLSLIIGCEKQFEQINTPAKLISPTPDLVITQNPPTFTWSHTESSIVEWYDLIVDGQFVARSINRPAKESPFSIQPTAPFGGSAHTWSIVASNKIQRFPSIDQQFIVPIGAGCGVPPTGLSADPVCSPDIAALKWNDTSDKASYIVELDEGAGFKYWKETDDGQIPAPSLKPGTFPWRVKASQNGCDSDWAEGPKLVVGGKAPSPTPSPGQPGNVSYNCAGAVDQNPTWPVFRWTTNAVGYWYEIQYDEAPGWTTARTLSSDINKESISTVEALITSNPTQYVWRLRPMSTTGCPSQWIDGDAFSVTSCSGGATQWARTMNQIPAQYAGTTQYISALAVDHQGSVYVAGRYSPDVYTHILGKNIHGMFLIKYDLNGRPLWVNNFHGATAGRINSMTVDSVGGIYIAGEAPSESFDLGAGPLPPFPTWSTVVVGYTYYNYDFIAKYNTSDGSVVWQKVYVDPVVADSFSGLAAIGFNNFRNIVYDPTNNWIWAVGSVWDVSAASMLYSYCPSIFVPNNNPDWIDSVNRAQDITLPYTPTRDVQQAFIAVFDPKTGSKVDFASFGGNGDQAFNIIRLGANGNVMVAGYLSGYGSAGAGSTVEGNGYPSSITLDKTYSELIRGNSFYVAQFSPSLAPIWSFLYDSTTPVDFGYQMIQDMDTDTAGNTYVSVSNDGSEYVNIQGQIFQGAPRLTNGNGMAYGSFLTKISPNGGSEWVYGKTNSGYSGSPLTIHNFIVGPCGNINVFVEGNGWQIKGADVLPPGVGTAIFSITDQADFRWTQPTSMPDNQATRMVADPRGYLIQAGTYSSGITAIGSIVLSNTPYVPSYGDNYIAKICF